MDVTESRVLQSNSILTNSLYKILSKEEGNVLFSPFSVHAILSMLYQGAEGDTVKAFIDTLKLPDVKSTASGYKFITNRINSINHVSVLTANRIYSDLKENQLKNEFRNIIEENFAANVDFVDFKNPDTVHIINKWVAERTNNKIRRMLDDDYLKNKDGLILINTVYFKGRWFFTFNEKSTKIDTFYLDNGNTIDVKMMYQPEKYYKYKKDTDIKAEILKLSFVGRDVKFIILLPFEDSSIKELESNLSTRRLDQTLKDLKRTQVILYLPKFKIEQTIKFNDILSEIGLENIFHKEKANFNGITESLHPNDNLYVDDVIQKVFIDVNEDGCEAGVATLGSVPKGCGWMKPEPVIFKVNRSCIFMVTISPIEATDNIIFYGRLSHPVYSVVVLRPNGYLYCFIILLRV